MPRVSVFKKIYLQSFNEIGENMEFTQLISEESRKNIKEA